MRDVIGKTRTAQSPESHGPGKRLTLPAQLIASKAVVSLPGQSLNDLVPVIEVLIQEGFSAFTVPAESTASPGEPDYPTSVKLMEQLRGIYSTRAFFGVHDVRCEADVLQAVSSDASFAMVAYPDPAAVALLNKCGIPNFVDALTPTEIRNAWMLGASAVHVAPASVFGAGYATALKTNAPNILLAASAEDEMTARAWAHSDVTMLTYGSELLSRVFLSRDYAALRQRARAGRQINPENV